MRFSTATLALLAPYAALASRILALTDSSSPSSSRDVFWRSLSAQGYELVVKDVQDAAPFLDERSTTGQFDHLILFAPSSKQTPKELSPQSIARRLSASKPTNLLLVLSPSSSEVWRDFAREFELDSDDRGQVVVDYFSSPSSSFDPSLLYVPTSAAPEPFISAATRAGPPVLYRGGGHLVGRNPLLTNILHASSSAFSTDVGSEAAQEDVRLAGSSVGLVSAFQARNNARVGFVGSSEMFEDASIDGGRTGNLAFLSDLVSWTFQKSGQLEIVSSKHEHTATGVEGSPTYRVSSELTYTVVIRSTSPPLTDLQAEFTMLDPHLRVPLHLVSQNGDLQTYSTNFPVPDRHGVFTLSLRYRRPGYTYLEDKHTVSVVPLQHNEYERFITGALPYYTGAASVSLAFLVFVAVWVTQS